MMRAFYVVLFATMLSSAVDSAITELPGIQNWGYRSGSSWVEVDQRISVLIDQDKFRSTEDVISKSLETTKNVFAKTEVKTTLNALSIGLSMVPVAGDVFSIISGIAGLLEDETVWKDEFKKVIADEMKKGHVINDLENFGDVVHSMKNRFLLLNETVTGKKPITWETAPEIIGFTTDIFSRLEEMIISFEKPDSHFKRHPLIAASFFIELSYLVLHFEPIALLLLNEASRYRLSCQMRDATRDFLPFVLAARFERTNLDLYKTKIVRNLTYSETGYTDANRLECGTLNADCSTIKGFGPYCLIDELNRRQYISDYNSPCEDIYARHLRGLVENRFPIGFLEKQCGQDMGEPTGNSLIFIKQMNSD